MDSGTHFTRQASGAEQAGRGPAESVAENLAALLAGSSAPDERLRITLTVPRCEDNFRATCPRCARICDLGAIYCAECGTRLYPAWSGKYGGTP